MLHSFRFQAMNTTIEAALWCRHDDIERFKRLTIDWFQKTEERFSRFREDSELSYLNRLSGQRCFISNAMLEVLTLAEAYRQTTGGIFNPLLLDALERIGYDRSFEFVKQQGSVHLTAIPSPANPERRLMLDPAIKSVLLPQGAKMDLGGIVKSWAVHRLSRFFQHHLRVPRGMINAGGDLAAWSESGDGAPPWLIEIEHPWQTTEAVGMLAFESGAAATSSKLGRAWLTARGPMHHLLNPHTLMPSDSDVVQATVAGKDAVECEIWAKTICILGVAGGLKLFAQKSQDCEALVFVETGEIHFWGDPEAAASRWRHIPMNHIHTLRSNAERGVS